MKQIKKLFSVFMGVVLAMSLFGVSAYAEEGVKPAESELIQQTIDNNPASPSSDELPDNEEYASSEAYESGIPYESESAPQELENSRKFSSKNPNTAKVEEVVVKASDAIGFVYVDEAIVALEQEQNIAFGLIDEGVSVRNARLDMYMVGQDKTVEVEAANVTAETGLFSVMFENDSEMDTYRLTGIHYEVGATAYYADFTTAEESLNYAFEVVSKTVSDVVKESAGISEDASVSAFVIEDDGSLVAKESVESAIDAVDAAGVQNVVADESVVDQGMVELGVTGEEEAAVIEESESGIDESEFFSRTFGSEVSRASVSSAREDYLIVALDPGHGGYDGGAARNGLIEKDVNFSIAQYCYNELNTYTGVTPVLTRSGDYYAGLQDRVDYALYSGADVFVSIHCNSGGGIGAEVWVPNDSSYNYGAHVDGKDLGNRILSKLVELGLENRGVRVRDSEQVGGEGPFYYPDGSIQDYYTVIESSREVGIPGIIVEHAFIDNASDASKLSQDSWRKKLGQADASGIAQKYSLLKDPIAQSSSLVKVKAHVSNVGWQNAVYDQKVAGTVGKDFGLQAFQANLQNGAGSAGGITYRSYVGGAWQGWASDGATSGTVGESKALQAVEVKLTGSASNTYDVYYRVHVAFVGWLGWAKNGASAGSVGYNRNAEALEVVVVPKGSAAPGDTTTPFMTTVPVKNALSYQAHVPYIGWQTAVSAGKTAGTVGQNLAIEALKVKISNPQYSGTIKYNLHCAYLGWQGWRENDALAGTSGESRQSEAIKIMLTGEMEKKFDVYYRAHSKDFGWLGWAKNGEIAGTEGYGFSMQAIQIVMVEKGDPAPGPTVNHSRASTIGYKVHVAFAGWDDARFDGVTAGTIGQSRAIEALQVGLRNQAYAGGLSYRTHVAYAGWQGWRTDDVTAGTMGQSRQIEAIELKLTGEMSNHFDIYYRVHSAFLGWLGWAKNGQSAGSTGFGYGVEAVEIVLVSKGSAAPGSTSDRFKEKQQNTNIMGLSSSSVIQMVKAFQKEGKPYPASVYAKYGAANITEFCTILRAEAQTEGVRAEVVFAQTMLETGWLQFGGDVKVDQCNFAGLGATGGVPGESFNKYGSNSVRMGLRAQVQHLKCYASFDSLVNEKIDPRWGNWLRGKAPYVEWLSIPNNPYGTGWAADANYATKIKTIMEAL